MSTRVIALVMTLFMCLANIHTMKDGYDQEDMNSFWQTLSDETESSIAPHINVKMYRCGESCARKCIGLAEKTFKYTNCTTVCMEPCVRFVVDGVYNCTFGCTKTLSLHSATGKSF